MAGYIVTMARTASTTLSLGTVAAFATRPRRGKWYEIELGSEASPGDTAILWIVQRFTAPGTNTAVTPQPIDPADAATESTAGQNNTIDATYTANQVMLRLALNQRATFRWLADQKREYVYPATASNGLGISTPTSTAIAVSATVAYEEQ